jgi:plasmid stabilization system protein ParE
VKVTSFHSLAAGELREAIRYYEVRSPGLGDRFLVAVESAVELLHQFPEIGTRVAGPLRRVLVSSFPYDLVYRPIGPGQLRILAVAHHRREPGYWSGRR